ncbi:MAG: putative lipid II flippase FtsW [Candidatus Sungbacteria bacterium]|nr:putative lipid II flippase FtsW [Candidatus Sungbacteria bacterium]
MPHTYDRPLVVATLLLLIGGLLVVASASVGVAQRQFGTISYYALRQFLIGGLGGIVAFFITQHTPYRLWRKLALPLMALSFLLLALVFFPEFSYSSGGARRWLRLGPVSFQPSELLKLAFVVYLATWLDARRREVSSIAYGMIPFGLMVGVVSVFLIMQPDIGTLGVIIASAGLLYFLGGGKVSQVVTLGLFGAFLFYIVVQIAPYRLERILVFLNPALDPRGIGYQINQAFIAIGSGGFWGLGFGKSVQKFSYLPEPMGDSVFAVFAEETGFFGAFALIVLFAFLIWRGIAIARRAPDIFGKLLAAGITITLAVQAFINMSAISGLLPLTGIPLPFVSYGGTALIMTMAGMGIVANVSKYT